jgi:DNA-binding MarR family transcriptional regulator
VSGSDFWDDKNLSWKAKGLLGYLIKKPKATITDLIKASKDQRTAVHTGLNELKKDGYLERYPIRDELGRIEAYENRPNPKKPERSEKNSGNK